MSGRDRVWKEFAAWCQARRLHSLPAHPWTLAAYLRWCERRLHHAAIVRRLRAIARVHLLSSRSLPDRHPLVMRVLGRIEVRERTRLDASDLFRPKDFVGDGGLPAAADEAASPDMKSRPRRRLRTRPRLVRRPSRDR